MNKKQSIGYTHGELVELLGKIEDGFVLNQSEEDFKSELVEKVVELVEEAKVALQAEIDADVKIEADRAVAAEEVLKEAIGVDAAEDQAASGVFVQINEAKAIAEQAQAEVDALELIVGVEGAEANEDQGVEAVEASGLFKMIADMKDEVFAEIDADVQAEADRAMAEEADIRADLELAIANAQQDIQANVDAVQNEVDALEELVGAKAVEGGAAASGVFKAIEDAEARINADILGKIGAGDNQVIAKITEAKIVMSAEIDADVKVEADRAVAAEEALQLALNEANAKIAALETKNAELLAALDLKAANTDLQALIARVALVEAFDARIDVVEGWNTRIQAVEAFESRIQAVEAFGARLTAVEALEERIEALENK